MSAYRKLIVAIVGVIVLLAQQHFGLDLEQHAELIVGGIIAALTALGVWGVKNDPGSGT